VSDAHVALLLAHLHIAEAGSLKSKRKELASAKAQLQTRLHVAVAEVDGQDTWQRSTLAIALTAGSSYRATQHADRVERFLEERFPDGCRVERKVRSYVEVD
jgi:uncharacterized protein YlxP (DUF503 family)